MLLLLRGLCRAPPPAPGRGPHPNPLPAGEGVSGRWRGVRLQVALPEVDVHALARLRRGPPERVAREADGVHRLGLLALAMRVGVWEDEVAAYRVDGAALPTGVARQPGVAGRVDVAGDDAVAD